MNGVDGVLLVVIQITDDPSAERTAPPRSTHVQYGRRLLLLDPARGKERLRKKAPAAARWRDDGGEAVLRQGFAKRTTEEEMCWGGEGLRLGSGVQPSPRPSIYRGRRKGAGPL